VNLLDDLIFGMLSIFFHRIRIKAILKSCIYMISKGEIKIFSAM